MEDLVRRGLRRPALASGTQGLLAALGKSRAETRIQRFACHKLENPLAKAPRHCRAALKRDLR